MTRQTLWITRSAPDSAHTLLETDKEEPMITLTTEPFPVRVDWMWTVSVERVLGAAPDLLTWADASGTE